MGQSTKTRSEEVGSRDRKEIGRGGEHANHVADHPKKKNSPSRLREETTAELPKQADLSTFANRRKNAGKLKMKQVRGEW